MDPPHAPGQEAGPAGGVTGLQGGTHFELQELDGRLGSAASREHANSDQDPALDRRWYSDIEWQGPIGFFLMKARDRGHHADMDGTEFGLKCNGPVRRFSPVRRRPGERLASALIFAAFVAVAAVVGIICVSSLMAAYQDEKATDNSLRDARNFVPAQASGALAVDSFADVQQPNTRMGDELSHLYRESAHHSWAGHDFDVAFVTGGDGDSNEKSTSRGRTQQLAGLGRSARTPIPNLNMRSARQEGGQDKSVDSSMKRRHPSSGRGSLQQSLANQADYIIGYPDPKGSPGFTRPVEVAAYPHLAGLAVPVIAHSEIVPTRSSIVTSAKSEQRPFDWVKKAGLVAKTGRKNVPARSDRASKFVEHASHVSKAQQAAEAARQIIIAGEAGKACFQEGHGSEPCPTMDYHPKHGEDWKGAPDRPGPAGASVRGIQNPHHVRDGPETGKSGFEWPNSSRRADDVENPASAGPGDFTSNPVAEGPLKVHHEHFGPPQTNDKTSKEGPPHVPFTGVPSASPAGNLGSGFSKGGSFDFPTEDTPDSKDQSDSAADKGSAVVSPMIGSADSVPSRGQDITAGPNVTAGPPPSAADHEGTTPPQQDEAGLSAVVGDLASVVSQLSGEVQRLVGSKTTGNVYVTNNYNNVTVQNVTRYAIIHRGTSKANGGKATSKSLDRASVAPLPFPIMWPNGGVYADQVVVHLDEHFNGSSLFYSTNASGTQGQPKEYTKPFVLGPGWTKVEALAIATGHNASAIKEAVFRVMACNNDKCCNWFVVYMRFHAVLSGLLLRKKELPKKQVELQAAKMADEESWLSAESKYQDAKIKQKAASSGAKYARDFERKWGFAFSTSKTDLGKMEERVERRLRELLDERELIMDILAKLEGDELSAPTAMGMIQQSLAQCEQCSGWRSEVESTIGNGASTFALASAMGGHQELKEVKKILQEILDDLNARRALYGKMLSNERLQVLDNEKKLNKWTNEVSEMTLEEYQDRKKIQMYGSKSQDAAGQVEVDKQKAQQGAEFMQEQMRGLDRHIAAMRRILKRIRFVLGQCPSNPEIALPSEDGRR